MTNKPTVTILVGLPASGKSTARAQAVANGEAAESFQYSTDDWVDAKAEELGVNYDDIWSDYIKEATTAMNEQVVAAIKQQENVLWDQTNMTRKKRRKILNRFPDNYQKTCLCILPPFTGEQEDEWRRRLAARPGKQIPEFVLENMRDSFQLPSTNEGFSHVFYFDIYGKLVEHNFAADLFGDGGGAG